MLANLNEDELAEMAAPFVVLRDGPTLAFFNFLFFGRSENNLQKFALRDLGVLKERNQGREIKPRFENRATALAVFRLEEIREEIRHASENDLIPLAESVAGWPCEDEPEVSIAASPLCDAFG